MSQTVFSMGMEAYRDGLLMSDNPFNKEDPEEYTEYRQWDDGWYHAMAADKLKEPLEYKGDCKCSNDE